VPGGPSTTASAERDVTQFDPYKVLQVDPEAESDVIAAAYRRLAQRHHPDRGGDPERMLLLNRAFEVLSDPARRAEHDATRPDAGASAPVRERTAVPDRPATTSGERERGTRPQAADTPEDVATFASGRSTRGGGYEASMRSAPVGPPPGRPSGSVLTFGRYAGWSLGEIARVDPGFLEWLDRMPIGRPYRAEIDPLLRTAGLRRSPAEEARTRRGLFRRP
jgi:curved DNA-binding protein CbpA